MCLGDRPGILSSNRDSCLRDGGNYITDRCGGLRDVNSRCLRVELCFAGLRRPKLLLVLYTPCQYPAARGLLGSAQLAQLLHRLVLGQAGQRLEQPVVVRVVGVVLDLREGEKLRPSKGSIGGGGGGLAEVNFSGGLREGDGVVEGGVAPVGHPEAGGGVDGGGVEHAG